MQKVLLNLKDVAYRYSDASKDDYVFKKINYSFEQGKVYGQIPMWKFLFWLW